MQSTNSIKNYTSASNYEVDTVFEAEVSPPSSSTDPPMEEWSSLLISFYEDKKLALYKKGLYSPDSGEVCAKYITLSDSEVLRHPYYKYPAVTDPGIVSALCDPYLKKKYDAVGQDLYLELCDETGIAPVRLFHRGLLKNVINLKYYCVNPNGVRNMCLALAENNIVQRLDLTSCFLNDDACFHLGELISTTSTLQELILAQCRIGYFGLLRLFKTLDIIKLTNLDLSKNLLGDEGMTVIGKKIIKGAKFKKLNLSYNNITMNGALALADGFTYNKNCCSFLNLSFNLLSSPKALKSLITSLYDFSQLKELNLSWCVITGGKYIADILMAQSLQKLDLSHNSLSVPAVEALRTRLRTAKSLKILNLSDNPLRPKEAYAMLQELRFQQVKLTWLLMDNIDVTKEFPEVMKEILSLKHRQKTKVTHGRVMSNYSLRDADFREIVLKRLKFISQKGPKKNRVDIQEYIVQKSKETPFLIPKCMMRDLKQMGSKINLSFIETLPVAFPGPKVDKNSRAIDLQSLADYAARIWPDAKASATEDFHPKPENETVRSPGKPAKTEAKKHHQVKKKLKRFSGEKKKSQ